jgi:hypothetical protein
MAELIVDGTAHTVNLEAFHPDQDAASRSRAATDQ